MAAAGDLKSLAGQPSVWVRLPLAPFWTRWQKTVRFIKRAGPSFVKDVASTTTIVGAGIATYLNHRHDPLSVYSMPLPLLIESITPVSVRRARHDQRRSPSPSAPIPNDHGWTLRSGPPYTGEPPLKCDPPQPHTR